jgi:hypothetical protein
MYELDSIRSEVRAAGLQQQPGRLRRPGMPATGTSPAGGLDPALSKIHGDILSASASPSSYTLPTGGLVPGMKSSSSASSSSNKKLGELAMAELLWQVKTRRDSTSLCVLYEAPFTPLFPFYSPLPNLPPPPTLLSPSSSTLPPSDTGIGVS